MFYFFACKLYYFGEIGAKPCRDQLVIQHGQQSRGQHHCHAKVDFVREELVEDHEQRDVAFQHRFVHPALFQAIVPVPVSYIRHMSVQHKGEITVVHS